MRIAKWKKECMRKVMPYCLAINSKTNEVYYVNRDYEFINLNTKSLIDLREDYMDFKKIWVYNDDSKPWLSIKNYRHASNEIERLTFNKKILNNNGFRTYLNLW